MQLAINGVDVKVSKAAIAQMLRERFTNNAPTAAASGLPAIGEAYQGGIYVGLTIHDNAPHALVLLSGEVESVNWKDALAFAEKQGGVLPSRFDQLVLFKNAKAQFKDAWYWSGEQSAPTAGYAWCQLFDTGTQTYYSKYNSLRARAVRRIPIE